MVKKDYAYIISESILIGKKVKPAVIRKIIRSSEKRWWFISGLYYGYPICCIIDFCNRGYRLTKNQRIFFKNRKGFVPCDCCCKKLIKKEITLRQLFSKRVCSKPFPKDDFTDKKINYA